MLVNELDDNTINSKIERKEYRILSEKTIDILFETDNEYVIYCVRQLCKSVSFEKMESTLIATAASELATNIIRYAKTGIVEIKVIENIDSKNIGIEIYAHDQGPGIDNIEVAMGDSYTTWNNSLGFGLASIKRIMDEFYIYSKVGRGTKILVRKWKVEKGFYD